MTVKTNHDQELAARVELCLRQRRPEFRKLSVLADNGTVYLFGELGSYYLRQLAISIASHVAGVIHVKDETRVSLPIGPPARPCAVVSIEPRYPGLRKIRAL